MSNIKTHTYDDCHKYPDVHTEDAHDLVPWYVTLFLWPDKEAVEHNARVYWCEFLRRANRYREQVANYG